MWGFKSKISLFKTLFWLIALLGLVFRVLLLPSYQFSYDELSALERATCMGWNDFWNRCVIPDAHPFLMQAYTVLWVKLWGFSNIALKAPLVILSLLNVYLAFKLGERLQKGGGYLMAAFFSASFIIVFHAPLARMYTPGLTFTLLLLGLLVSCWQAKTITKKAAFTASVIAWLLSVTHHMGALLVITLLPLVVFAFRYVSLKPIFWIITFFCLMYLPLLPVTWMQFQHSGIGPKQGGWLDAPHWSQLYKWIQVWLGTGFCTGVFVMVIVWILWKHPKILISKMALFGLYVFFINLFIIYFYSVYRAPVFQYSVLMFSGIGLLVFWIGIMRVFSQNVLLVISFIILCVFSIQTYGVKSYYPQHVESAYEHSYTTLAGFNKADSTSALVCNTEPFIHKLMSKKYSVQHLSLASYEVVKSVVKTEQWLSEQNSKQLFLASPFPDQLIRALTHYPHVLYHHETATVNEYLLTKSPVTTQQTPYCTILKDQWPHSKYFIYKSVDTMLSGETEFPFTIYNRSLVSNFKEGDVLVVKATSSATVSNDMELCLVIQSDSSKNTWAYNARPFIGNTSVTGLYFGSWIHRMNKKPAVVSAYIWNRKRKKIKTVRCSVEWIRYWPEHWKIWH